MIVKFWVRSNFIYFIDLWVTLKLLSNEMKNELLSWRPEDWGGVRQKTGNELIIDKDRIWVPDMVLYNVAGSNHHFMQRGVDSAKIYPNGDNLWNRWYTFICKNTLYENN